MDQQEIQVTLDQQEMLVLVQLQEILDHQEMLEEQVVMFHQALAILMFYLTVYRTSLLEQV